MKSQNISEAIKFFEEIEQISWEEARELITSFYDHYIAKFGADLLNNEEYVKNLEHCKKIYHSILESQGISLENSLIRYDDNSSFSILLCKKKKSNIETMETEKEIPGAMVLGAVEILGGALVWILPFPGTKVLGGAMIGDGIRRTFNGLEELNEEKKNKKPFFSEGF